MLAPWWLVSAGTRFEKAWPGGPEAVFQVLVAPLPPTVRVHVFVQSLPRKRACWVWGIREKGEDSRELVVRSGSCGTLPSVGGGQPGVFPPRRPRRLVRAGDAAFPRVRAVLVSRTPSYSSL